MHAQTTIPPEFLKLDQELRFIKVIKGRKEPVECWLENNYSVNDPSLIQWVQSGGNYGYFLQDNTDLCVLDADKPEELAPLIEYIGPTLTVQSGREGIGYHKIFRCPDLGPKKIYLFNTGGESLGDIRPGSANKKYFLVGPGSIHPDTGRPYTIVDSSDPVIVDREGLLQLLQQYTKPVGEKKASKRGPIAPCTPVIVGDSPGRYLDEWGLSYRVVLADDGFIVFKLDDCPFSPDHSDGCYVAFNPDLGTVVARCYHDRCGGDTGPNRWDELVERFGPIPEKAKEPGDTSFANIRRNKIQYRAQKKKQGTSNPINYLLKRIRARGGNI
jgi:hypothetical protein